MIGKKFIILVIFLCGLVGLWFIFSEIYTAKAQDGQKATFRVEKNESIAALATRLEQERVVRQAWLFRRYVQLKGIDKHIQAGEFVVEAPITLARVARALTSVRIGEREITMLPGWDLRDIASYLEEQGIGSAEEFFAIVGEPAKKYQVPIIDIQGALFSGKPNDMSYEGYLAPDTYRIFSDASIDDVIKKLLEQQDTQFTPEMYRAIANAGRTPHDILTMASILEREVRGKQDKENVADLFWRRYDKNWALQADSTVHYAVGKKRDVFTTKEDRDSLNPWNTYQYPGLPPGPISSPSVESILAAIYPQKNEYWYFLTDLEGVVHYGKTLEEHNANRIKYL